MVLPGQQLSDDSEMIKFLTLYVGKFDFKSQPLKVLLFN